MALFIGLVDYLSEGVEHYLNLWQSTSKFAIINPTLRSVHVRKEQTLALCVHAQSLFLI